MAGYVIGHVEIHDMETYAKYREQVPPTIEHYGGRYLVRGGDMQQLEGEGLRSRTVVLEFPTYEQALTWYNSPEYSAIKTLRLQASEGDLMVVHGI